MARVAITEYAAKKLFLGDSYTGVSVTPDTVEDSADMFNGNKKYIVKVDVGVKKRGKQGLVRIGVGGENVSSAAQELFSMGYDRCIVEEMISHDETDEKYVSFDLVRDGVQVLYSSQGGVAIEEKPETVTKILVSRSGDGWDGKQVDKAIPYASLLETMDTYHFSFCEINPFITIDGVFTPLDMAVEVDSAKESKLPAWAHEHVLHKKAASAQEEAVLEQDARTQAALNLHTLNENGSILTLFSGGGASLVALDSLVSAGLSDQVINYSEYSGAPTRDETAAYVSTLLEVLFASSAEKKVVLIAGGVANFTDVMATFQGIVDAFSKNIEQLKAQNVYVCVRRGGPNQENGLAHLRSFLDENSIANDVHDPSLSLGKVGSLVATHV